MTNRKQILTMVSIAVAFFLLGTAFSITTLAGDMDRNPFTAVWEAIYELEARIQALETPTKITIEAYPSTDTLGRFHGLSIDEPLPDIWWVPEDNPYTFKVTSSAFTYTTSIRLEHGSHYVEYAASGWIQDYAWHAKIYINDVLKAEGEVARDNHLRAYFDV